jgi:RecA/RadA recombinase
MQTVYITASESKYNGVVHIESLDTDYKMTFHSYTRKQAIDKAKKDIRSLLQAKRLDFVVIDL